MFTLDFSSELTKLRVFARFSQLIKIGASEIGSIDHFGRHCRWEADEI